MEPRIWYSFQGGSSPDDHIGFYDKEKLEWANILENNWEVIAKEISDFIEHHQNQLKPYFNQKLVSKKKSWKTFAFLIWGWRVRKNIKQCPETNQILRKIPNLVSASVSILEANTEIKPHRGDTNAIMRCHLGLRIPSGLPECGLKVKYEERAWEEGKVLVFNDAARHTAWNLSGERRYVLLVDVVRPEFANKKFQVCSMVLTGLMMQAFAQKINLIKKLPRILLKILFLGMAGFVYVALLFRRLF